MAHAAADRHILSLTLLRGPLKGDGFVPQGPGALQSSVYGVLSLQWPCIQFTPLDSRHVPHSPPKSAPQQSTIAWGMQNNAS